MEDNQVKEQKLRKFWFFPRPIRDPQFHEDGLLALQKATENFTKQWYGDRDRQRLYEQYLIDAGMKRNHLSTSSSSARTWSAMLRLYNYVYIDGDKKIVPTKVGKAIVNGKKVRQNIAKQILTYQIPNAYFLNDYGPEYHIQPIIFIIKLVNDKRLDKFLSAMEITLFAMTAEKDRDYESKIKEILHYRNVDDVEKKAIAESIFLERGDISRKDSKKNYGKYTDVAKTITILCRFTGYAKEAKNGLKGIDDPDKLKEFERFCKRYPFNERIYLDPDFYILSAGLDVDTYKTQYGVVAKPATRNKKRILKVQQILNRFPSPEELSIEQLEKELKTRFNSEEAKSIAIKIKSRKFDNSGDAFLETYRHEENNLEFERKTAHVAEGLGLTVEMHPKPTSEFNNGNEDIDIMATTPDGQLILIDAKNYAEKFQLSAGLRNKMATSYLRGYMGYNGKDPHYYCYVTAAKSATISNLLKINELAKRDSGLDVHGMMISATAIYYLQKYFAEKQLPAEKRAEMFLRLFNDEKYESFVRIAEVLNITDYEFL